MTRQLTKNSLSRRVAALAGAVMALAVVAGCDGGRAGYTAFTSDGWAYCDTLSFDDVTPVDSADTAPRSLSVALRHTNDYRYSNIWLEVGYTDLGGSLHTDTVDIELCDPYGRWYGSGIGDLFQIERPLAANIVLMPGRPVTVRHIMRVDTLRGVERVGVFYAPN